MNTHHHISYIEFTAADLSAIKKFYTATFGWKFTDYGPDYIAFQDSGIEGGFAKGKNAPTANPLVILYSENLEKSLEMVRTHGGNIVKQIYNFPGGRRFHFTDPALNELAVWSDR